MVMVMVVVVVVAVVSGRVRLMVVVMVSPAGDVLVGSGRRVSGGDVHVLASTVA